MSWAPAAALHRDGFGQNELRLHLGSATSLNPHVRHRDAAVDNQQLFRTTHVPLAGGFPTSSPTVWSVFDGFGETHLVHDVPAAAHPMEAPGDPRS